MRLRTAFLLAIIAITLVVVLVLIRPGAHQAVTLAPLGDPPAGQTALPLSVIGRAALSPDGTRVDYSWPLSGAQTWFSGDTVTVRISDTPGRLSLKIDGQAVADLAHPGNASVTVRGLKSHAGGHHLEIVKYNESLGATGHLLGVYGDAARPTYQSVTGQMEVIGDSWTAGYGDLSDSHVCTPLKLSDTTDARLTWGVQVAGALGLDMHMAAYSGIGIVRNYGGQAPGVTMPAIYDNATFGDKRPYDATGWQPQLIVIALGGNDFETPLRPGEAWPDMEALRNDFVTRYVAFIRKLRRDNPKAGIVLMNYGEVEVVGATRKILTQLKSEGETRIATYTAPGPFEQTGCDWHLNGHDYHKIADGLMAWLRQNPEIWQGR